MPMVIQPLGEESVNSEISCTTSDHYGLYIAWGTYDGLLKIKNIETSEIKSIQLENYAKQIIYSSNENFIVGQNEGNIISFSKNCENIWEVNTPSGCELLECTEMGDLIVLIDGTNSLRTISSKGIILGEFSKFEIIGMSINKKGSSISCWDDEGNLFVLDRNCNLIFKREKNQVIGERIICTKFTDNGVLVVSKESLEIPENGEQNELEFWNPLGQKIKTLDLNSKCVTLGTYQNNIFAGLFNGEIHIIENYNSKLIWKSDYSITKIIPINNDILVSSWFYLFRINIDNKNEVWRIEHEGIIDHLVISLNKKILILAGNDRNDFTNPAPLKLVDPDSKPYWEEEKDDLIYENNDNLVIESNIYKNSNNDLIEILGVEYEQYKSKNNKNDLNIDNLIDAFEEETQKFEKKTDIFEDSSLIEHLLSNDDEKNITPICNAGDDQNLQTGDDGSCIVILDGSSSYDPNGHIRFWNWTNEDGNTLANEPKIKLRLPKGIHRFTLNVTDNDGCISTDSIIVRIT